MTRDPSGDRVGELSIPGGADIDTLDFLEVFRFAFGDLTGDEDSAPDWKMLLSSQPLSSVPGPNCAKNELSKLSTVIVTIHLPSVTPGVLKVVKQHPDEKKNSQ